MFGRDKKTVNNVIVDFAEEIKDMVPEMYARDLSDIPTSLIVGEEDVSAEHFKELLSVLSEILQSESLKPKQYYSLVRRDGRRMATYVVLKLIQEQWEDYGSKSGKGWEMLNTLLLLHDPQYIAADDVLSGFSKIFD